jgi:hypothetical protein
LVRKLQERIIQYYNNIQILQPLAHAGSSLADFYTLKLEAILSSETSVHTRSTQRHIPEDGILHRHHCENLKSYWALVFREYLRTTQISDKQLEGIFCLTFSGFGSKRVFVGHLHPLYSAVHTD